MDGEKTKFSVGQKVWVCQYHVNDMYVEYSPVETRIVSVLVFSDIDNAKNKFTEYSVLDEKVGDRIARFAEDGLFKSKRAAEKVCDRLNKDNPIV